MEQRDAHPLDIDLLSVALEDADVALTSEVNEHLATCLLCRVRIARIRRSGAVPAPPSTVSIRYPTVSPEVLAILDGSRRPDTIEAGQVWLAGDSHRVLLWIDAVDDDMAFVYAATFDADSADDTSLIERLPRLGYDIAVFTSVGGTVPLERLDLYVDYLPIQHDVERLIDAAANGTLAEDLPTGVPITGGTDERLEFRQLLADDLAALDPIESEDDEPLTLPTGGGLDEFDRIVVEMRDHLRTGLGSRRGSRCYVHEVDELLIGSLARSINLVPIANVQELDCKVLVVTGDTEPGWAERNSEDAYELMLRAGVSTLAVAVPFEPYDTRVFEPPHLHEAFELPDARDRFPPRAVWDARPMVKALFDYLDGSVFKIENGIPAGAPSSHPDLSPHLRSRAREAIDSLRKIRATLGKNRALKALNESDADEVASALAQAGGLDEVLAQIEQIVDR